VTTLDLAAGETLIRKGEKAKGLYYLADGELEITDFGKILQPGAILGEIGVFAQDQERTATLCAAPTAACTSCPKARPSSFIFRTNRLACYFAADHQSSAGEQQAAPGNQYGLKRNCENHGEIHCSKQDFTRHIEAIGPLRRASRTAARYNL